MMEILLEFELLSWLVGVVIIIAIYYWYYDRRNDYWKLQNVPSTNGSHFRKILSVVKGQNVYQHHVEQYKKYGRVFGTYFFGNPVLNVCEPDLLRAIFVKDFHNFSDKEVHITDFYMIKMLSSLNGEDWKRMRMLVSPVFTSGKMRRLANLVNMSAETLVKTLLKSADSGTNVELKRYFGAFAIDVIAATSFGTVLDSINNPDNPYVIHAHKIFDIKITWRKLFFVLAPKLAMKLKINCGSVEATDFFSGLVYKIREQRLADKKGRDDFIQMLLDAELETTDDQNAEESKSKKRLSKDELVAQCMAFFLGGYETTGTTLSFIAYNLALHQECQNRLLKEVDEVWEKHGMVDFDIVNGMKYLEAVISETLRMYPPFLRHRRRSLNDYQLGNTGISIPKGGCVEVFVYPIHHDPEFYPDPETFNPDRFLPENKDSINPYAYIPFSIGPRRCVAVRFAMMELKLCFVNILRHLTFHTCPETKIPLEFNKGLSLLLQPKSVNLTLRRRKHLN